jgi:hypothetical protein
MSRRCGRWRTSWSDRRIGPGRQPRYREGMPHAGGLKLRLQTATPNDRRARFAEVRLSDADGENARALVTDSTGRMRFRLPDGDYRLRVSDGPETGFAVHDQRWTTVCLKLT